MVCLELFCRGSRAPIDGTLGSAVAEVYADRGGSRSDRPVLGVQHGNVLSGRRALGEERAGNFTISRADGLCGRTFSVFCRDRGHHSWSHTGRLHSDVSATSAGGTDRCWHLTGSWFRWICCRQALSAVAFRMVSHLSPAWLGRGSSSWRLHRGSMAEGSFRPPLARNAAGTRLGSRLLVLSPIRFVPGIARIPWNLSKRPL